MNMYLYFGIWKKSLATLPPSRPHHTELGGEVNMYE